MNLYRHFNSEGQLLYVGISNSALVRLGAHKANAHWFDSITNVTIEKCTDREDALAKEAKAIKTEHPRHNVVHKQEVIGYRMQAFNTPEGMIVKWVHVYENDPVHYSDTRYLEPIRLPPAI